MGSNRKRAYINILFLASIAMLILWVILDILDLYLFADWVFYTRGYREYIFYAAIIMNIAALLLRRKIKA